MKVHQDVCPLILQIRRVYSYRNLQHCGVALVDKASCSNLAKSARSRMCAGRATYRLTLAEGQLQYYDLRLKCAITLGYSMGGECFEVLRVDPYWHMPSGVHLTKLLVTWRHRIGRLSRVR